MSTTFKLSTGLRNHLLTGGSFKGAMDGTVLRIYAGTVPTAADDSIGSATLLCTLTKDGGGLGLSFDTTPVAGVLSNAPTEEWYGTNVASGTATFFRMSAIADTGASSSTEKRIQGSVGLVSADFLVRDVVFVNGNEQRCDSANIGMPESE